MGVLYSQRLFANLIVFAMILMTRLNTYLPVQRIHDPR